MEIVPIFEPHLYSIWFDNEKEDEYHRLVHYWMDSSAMMEFFTANENYLKTGFWNMCNTPEKATQRVLNDASRWRKNIKKLNENSENGKIPDLDQYFKEFGGKYLYISYATVAKGYGMESPSFLRIYAIRMGSNVYLITGGGIKLNNAIQNSPELDKELKKIDHVIQFLKEKGICDKDDL